MDDEEKSVLSGMLIISLGIIGFNLYGMRYFAQEWTSQETLNPTYFLECEKYSLIAKITCSGIMTYSALLCLILCISLLNFSDHFLDKCEKYFIFLIYAGFGPGLMFVTGYSLHFYKRFFGVCYHSRYLPHGISKEIIWAPVVMTAIMLFVSSLITICFAFRITLTFIAYLTRNGRFLSKFADWTFREKRDAPIRGILDNDIDDEEQQLVNSHEMVGIRLMACTYILLSSLFSIVLSVREEEKTEHRVLEHKYGSEGEWTPRGMLTLWTMGDARISRAKVGNLESIRYSSHQRAINEICSRKQLYSIKVNISDNLYMSSLDPCELVETKMKDSFDLTVDKRGHLVSIYYSPDIRAAKIKDEFEDSKIISNLTFTLNRQGSRPKYLKIKYDSIGNELKVNDPLVQEEQTGFFGKYWMYIAGGVVLFIMCSNMMKPQEGEGGAPA